MSSSRPEDAGATARERRRRRRGRRVPGAMAVFAAGLGLFAFSTVAGSPRFEAYHALDVIRLMTAGAGLGVALVLLIQVLNSPGPRSEAETETGQGAP